MELWMQPLGAIQTNGYVLSHANGEAIIIDPGAAEQSLMDHIESFDVKAILLTHAHFDHVGGLEAMRELTGAPVYLHDQEQEWLLNPAYNGSSRWPSVTEPIICMPSEHSLVDGQILHLAGFHIQALYTPGHSPGSVSFYVKEENFVIAGDTLFYGSIGRTDLHGGDHSLLISSIQDKLMTLPSETKVYPGHGPATSISEEKASNPFLTV